MHRIMARGIANSLQTLKTRTRNNTTKLYLAAWLREVVTAATTDSIYGPKNPFKDPAISQAFWYEDPAPTLRALQALTFRN